MSLNERELNRTLFLDGVISIMPSGGKLYVLVSPSYDIYEDSRDLANALSARLETVRVSRSPYRHFQSEAVDVAHLCKEAEGSDLVVYLARRLCDHFIEDLSSGKQRHGHHVDEAVAVAKHLDKVLFIGYLNKCDHTHKNGLEASLFYVGGSLKVN